MEDVIDLCDRDFLLGVSGDVTVLTSFDPLSSRRKQISAAGRYSRWSGERWEFFRKLADRFFNRPELGEELQRVEEQVKKRWGASDMKSGVKFSNGSDVVFAVEGTEHRGVVAGSREEGGRTIYNVVEGKTCWDVAEESIISTVESKIAKMEVRPVREVFGENAHNPDRPAIVIWTENGARLPLMVPLGARYANGTWEVFDPEAFDRSISHERSKFGAFLHRYKTWPHIGKVVGTRVDKRGYLVIEV